MRYLVETLLYCIIQNKLKVPDEWKMPFLVRMALIIALLVMIYVFNYMFIMNGKAIIDSGNNEGYALIILILGLDAWGIFYFFDLYYFKYKSMMR